MKIELGATYKDRITGFFGVATAYVQYITGCNQALLSPPSGKDNKLTEPDWFDEQRLTKMRRKAIVLDDGNTTGSTGFGPPAPKR